MRWVKNKNFKHHSPAAIFATQDDFPLNVLPSTHALIGKGGNSGGDGGG